MTGGNALNPSCPVRWVIRVARLGTIGGSSKPCFGPCAPAVPGVTCLPGLGTGTARMCVSLAGASRASGSGWQQQCTVMPTWSICSSTPPLFAPTSIPPAPKKSGQSGNRAFAGWADDKIACGRRRLGQSGAHHALGRTGRRYRPSHSVDQGSARGLHRRRQGVRLGCLRRSDHGARQPGCDPATLQSAPPALVRSASLQRSQFDRAFLLSHQAIQTHRHALRQTRHVFSGVHPYRMCFRLAGLIENRP